MFSILKHAENAVFIYTLPPAAVSHYPEAAFRLQVRGLKTEAEDDQK